MEKPADVEISEQDWSRLKELQQGMEATDKFIQQMLTRGKAMIAAQDDELQRLWAELANTYNLDLGKMAYAPDRSKPLLRCIGVRFEKDGPPG